MATAHTSTTMNEKASIDDLIKCPICLDYYNDPRLLPCSHTFCFPCIQSLCKNGSVPCPMGDKTIIHRQFISQLPINRIAKDFVEYINNSSQSKPSLSQTKCNHCNKVVSEFVCDTCSKHYCTACLKLHHNINQLKTHTIKIIINKNLNYFCPEHNEEKQKYWCNPCEQTVCSDCLLFKHKQHSFITIQEIAQQTKTQLQLTSQKVTSMKEDLEKLNDKTAEARQTHYQAHVETKDQIEQMIYQLQTLLEERKKYLINLIAEKDVEQQKIIRQQKSNIEEYLKSVLIKEFSTKQLLKIEDPFQLVKINSNELNEEQYEQLMQGWIFDVHQFDVDRNFSRIQQEIEVLGDVSTHTLLTNTDQIHPLLKLSELSGKEKHQQFQGIYAYGYRFYLTAPLKINVLRVKIALFDTDLIVYILNHDDLLIQKEIIKSTKKKFTGLNWITISLNCEIQNNYYIFIWTQSNDKSVPYIAYRDSTHGLRKINEYVSIRSKRAQIDTSTNININTKFNVLYEALLNNDERNQTTVPAIEMILDR